MIPLAINFQNAIQNFTKYANFARLYFPMLFAEMVLFVPISIFLKFRLKGDCSLEYSRCCLHDFMLFSFYCMYNSCTTNKTYFLFFQASLMKK